MVARQRGRPSESDVEMALERWSSGYTIEDQSYRRTSQQPPFFIHTGFGMLPLKKPVDSQRRMRDNDTRTLNKERMWEGIAPEELFSGFVKRRLLHLRKKS